MSMQFTPDDEIVSLEVVENCYPGSCFYADADHIERKGVVAVYLYQADFLNMFRSSLIFRSIHFLLPIGVIFIMRSSPVNSLTSYLHQSMIISALRFDVEPGAIILLDEVEDLFPTNGNQEIMC
ncbi:hypothetical protein Tco_0766913 [Tanacetum coccineum]